MAVKKTTNSKNSRPDGDITTPVATKVDFTENSDRKQSKDSDISPFMMIAMMETTLRQNALTADALPDSLGLYIPEDFEVDDNASTRLNGETITSNNFYSRDGSYGGDFSSFGGLFSKGQADVSGFIPKLGKLSNIHADGTFDQAFAIVVAAEGGFSNNKADRGGATIFGIASRSNPAEYEQVMSLLKNGDKQGAMNLTMQVYKQKYWDVAGIDRIKDPEARLVAFDASINHGAGYARKMISRVGDDAEGMLKYRANTYIQIVENDSSQQVFMNGWRNRLGKLASIVANDAAPAVQVASTQVKPAKDTALAKIFDDTADKIKVPHVATPAAQPNLAATVTNTLKNWVSGFDHKMHS